MDELIERLRYEADISDRPGQFDRLNAIADEFAAALAIGRRPAADGVIQRLAEFIDPIFIDRRMLALYQYGILDYDRVSRRWTVAPIGHSFAGYRTEPKKETAVEA